MFGHAVELALSIAPTEVVALFGNAGVAPNQATRNRFRDLPRWPCKRFIAALHSAAHSATSPGRRVAVGYAFYMRLTTPQVASTARKFLYARIND